MLIPAVIARLISSSLQVPMTRKFKAANAQTVPLSRALIHGRVALHTVGDCNEIEAFLDLVTHRAFGELLFAPRNHNLELWHLVDRIGDSVADGFEGA